MGTYEELKAAIRQVIRTNGNKEITGALLQNALISIVNVVGANATFAGIATPNTNPGTADQNVFYLATEAGTYINFGGIEINMGEAVILSNKTGNWVKTTSGFATQQQLTELESDVIGIDSKSERLNPANVHHLAQYIDRCYISFDEESISLGYEILLDYFSWYGHVPNALYFQIIISNNNFQDKEVAEIRVYRNAWKKGEFLYGEHTFASGVKIRYILRAAIDFNANLSIAAANRSVPILPYEQMRISMPNGEDMFEVMDSFRLSNIAVEHNEMINKIPSWLVEYKVWNTDVRRVQMMGVLFVQDSVYFGISDESGITITQPPVLLGVKPNGIKEYNVMQDGFYFHLVIDWDNYTDGFYGANTGIFLETAKVGESEWLSYFGNEYVEQSMQLSKIPNLDVININAATKFPSWVIEYKFWTDREEKLQALGVAKVDNKLFVGVSDESGNVINQPSISIGTELNGIKEYNINSGAFYYHVVVDWDNYTDGFFGANTGIYLNPRPINEKGWNEYFGGEIRCKANDNLVKICCENIGRTIIIESGIHDIIEEYAELLGADYWDKYEGYNSGIVSGQGVGAGIPLMRGTKLICSPNAIITCHYNGANPNVRTYFSAFACGDGYEIDGMWLDCSGLRYAIHDDYNTTNKEYHVIIRNSHIVNTNQAIGGGLGYCGNYLIENNYIESIENWYDMRYHNSAGASKNRLTFVGNYFAKRLRIANYGISALHTSECFASNNSMALPIVHDNETDEFNVENIKLYEWNNHIR